jgi:hypothetical protein
MDVSYLADKGWKYTINLDEGIESVYKAALERGVLDI